MSLLTEKLQSELVICGKACPINTDFRVWIKFAELMQSDEEPAQKAVRMISLIFKEGLPPNLFEAFYAVMDFYSGPGRKTQRKGTDSSKSIYDYNHDAEMIAAAFMQQYGINLSEADMHWHVFRAYFDNLSEETKFVKVLGYRSVKLSTIKDKKMKKHYAEMKALYKLPDGRTEAQKEDALNNSFAEMFI